tara:strand:- start:649 stop:807 length:159 start_codon:yes stop_codon:yes gene_type:complete
MKNPQFRIRKYQDGVIVVANAKGVVVYQSRDRAKIDSFVSKNVPWNADVKEK